MKRFAANYIFPITSAPIKNGYVEVEDDGTIVKFGPLEKEMPSTQFYNGIIVPGFINAHCHIELSHLKGKFRKGSGMAGFIDQINELRESAPEHVRKARIKEEMDSLWEQGVSAMADISNCDESFNIKRESPLYTRTFIEVFGTEPEDASNVIEGAEKILSIADEAGIDASITPHSPYTMSPELLTMAAEKGLERGFISYHNQESSQEEDMISKGCGELYENYVRRGLSTPAPTGKPAMFHFAQRLEQVHPGPFNEHILLIHNTVTAKDSIEMAKDKFKNVTFVTCPLSNIFIHERVAPLDLFMKEGVSIAIGTDSLSSNDILSIVQEIKCIQKHFPSIGLGTVLEWATINGAQALQKSDTLGSIEAGKRPGIVLIDNIDFSKMKLTENSKSTRLI
ncbi:MAG: amidohydrolase family protein [Bacteroidales bacterium]|nr:amidohydrolase family protein [Bacteroidales bacterium]